jgi:hypothetical protein
MRFFIAEQISPNIAETPEGFLVAAAVPIARTGMQEYNKSESDLMPWISNYEADADGRLIVERNPEEVFRPETIASFEGKSITIDHPYGFVIPENWTELENGTMQNVRQGSDIQSDLLLADFIIKDPAAIEFVKSGELRQVSCGYDAEYEQIAPGRLRQINIIGNHVALVKHGRAGVRCMIMDSIPKEETIMTFKEALKNLFAVRAKTVDGMSEEEAEKKLKEEEKTKDAVDPEEGKELTALEKVMAILEPLLAEHKALKETVDCMAKDKATKDADSAEEEKKKKEEEEKEKESGETKDSIARAAILVPEFRPADGARVLDIRKGALRAAFTKDAAAVEPFLAGKTIDALSADAINAAFIGASELAAAKNNMRSTILRPASVTTDKGPQSIAEINKANAEFYKGGN